VAVYCSLYFILSVNFEACGNESSITCFIFNVCGSISICLYVCCDYLDVGVVVDTASQW
jgi:hypothetical protein